MTDIDKLKILIYFLVMLPFLAMLVPYVIEEISWIRHRRYMHKENKKIGTKEWYENR